MFNSCYGKHHKICKICCALICIGCFGALGFNHVHVVDAQKSQVHLVKSSLPKHHTIQQLSLINQRRHLSHDAQYRIYSHHFLAIEHRDLLFLRVLGNHYGRLTNSIATNNYSSSSVYKKYHDGNYWSIFHTIRAPGNFKHSHMSNNTYNFVNKRVLKAHGVYSGINFSNRINETSFSRH